MHALRATIASVLLGLLASFNSQAESLNLSQEPYTYGTPSRGGIGKFYHGREIAQVMGHRGARWLERNTRVFEEAPELAVQAMDLPSDAVVADIGAGTGYFTFRLAAQVPAGQVYAVDIQTEMLDIIRKRMHRRSVDNVVPITEVSGTSVDQVFIGTCTNGRLEDIEIAARILQGKKVHPKCRLIITPASTRVLLEAIHTGYMASLIEAGATFATPGCGPCLGAHQGVLASGEVCVTTSSRNFPGRMGSTDAAIYSVSPIEADC